MMGERVTRRALLKAAGAAGVSGATTGIATSTARVTDPTTEIGGWTQFRHGVANRGYAPTESGPTSGIEQRWRFKTSDIVTSSPAVVDGTVYVGSDDGTVYALSASDGTEQWTYQTGDRVHSSPAVVDGTVYVGSHDWTVYALSASDGTEQWTYQTGGGVGSSPAVDDGTVCVGSDDGTVYTLSASDGTEQWTYQTGDRVHSSPAVVDGTVYVGSHDFNVYALNVSDGTERWTYQTGGWVYSSPAVGESTVYVSCTDSNVYALSASDGTEQWTYQTGGPVHSSPAVGDGTIYVGSDDSYVYALDASDGTEQWRVQTNNEIGSSPAVVDGSVYVGSWKGTCYAIDASDGTKQWRFQADDAVFSSPAVVDGIVYVGSHDFNVYALASASTPTPTDTPSATPTDTPSPTPTDTASPTPTNTPSPTPTDTPSPIPTDTPTEPTVGSHSDGNGGGTVPDGVEVEPGLLPLAVGGGVLGTSLLGGLAWWYRSGSDGSPATGDGPDSKPGPNAGAAASQSGSGSGTVSAADVRGASQDSGSDDTFHGAAGDQPSECVSDRPAAADDRQGPPTMIPTAPTVTVEYEALTDRKPIGAGGNADVTRATLPTGDGEVTLAVKEPRMSGTLHSDQVQRLLTEAETWDKLDDNDHIVGVVDYGSEPVPWIAMEYMDGGHLGDRADGMDLSQALWTAIAVTKGVRHAHRRGVAHLDLKPENVLFRTVEDAWDVPKVADWGLSKHLLDHSESIEGLTPEYAAPEQFTDEHGPVDDVTDVYQLGAVFYELFTGRPPFGGDPARTMHQVLNESPTPPSEMADVPEKMDDVLLRALAKRKDDRYESVLYFRDALRELFETY